MGQQGVIKKFTDLEMSVKLMEMELFTWQD
jgi:hypothetical protein